MFSHVNKKLTQEHKIIIVLNFFLAYMIIKNKKELIDNCSNSQNRKARKLALEAIEFAINAVNPKKIIKSKVSLRNGILKVGNYRFNLKTFNHIYLVGGGKASGLMAETFEEILGDYLSDGLVIIPHQSAQPKTRIVKILKGSHPLPDNDGVKGTKKIMEIAEKTTKDDLLICVLSGGGSSLMSMPKNGISLQDKRKVIEALLKSGARIDEINTVRKHLSSFKGGQLAKKAFPATILNIILSDVVGDELSVIASGPTVPDPTTFKDAINVLKKYDLWEKAPESIKEILSEGTKGRIAETPKEKDKIFEKVYSVIVGNNRTACLAAIEKLKDKGLNTLLLTSHMEGEAREVGLFLAAIAREITLWGTPVKKPAAVVVGGETTVTVRGKGLGGRNQEIALSASTKLQGLAGNVIASISTDGIDGPTDAAGAIVDGETSLRSRKLGLDIEKYLEENDSYTFFKKLNDLIYTGPTGTNVNDIAVIISI